MLFIIYMPWFILRKLGNQQDQSFETNSTFYLLSSNWFILCYSIWFRAACDYLLQLTQTPNGSHVLILRLCFFIPLIYIVLPWFLSFLGFFLPINDWLLFITFDFFGKLQLLALLSFLYPIYFISKNLTTIEFKRQTNSGEFVLTFINLIILPLGLLLVQPRLRKLLI